MFACCFQLNNLDCHFVRSLPNPIVIKEVKLTESSRKTLSTDSTVLYLYVHVWDTNLTLRDSSNHSGYSDKEVKAMRPFFNKELFYKRIFFGTSCILKSLVEYAIIFKALSYQQTIQNIRVSNMVW